MSSLSEQLLELGFSANDAEVYQALLKQGPCMAGPLITETGFHRNIVYTSLAHLIARKLVTEQQVKGRAQFAVADPRRLVDEYAAKATLATKAMTDIRARLSRPAQEITIHHGNEEYVALLTSLIKQIPMGGEKYVLGTGGAAFMRVTMVPMWEAYHEVAREQKLKIKMIGYEPQREAIEPWIKKEGMYEARYLRDQWENPSGIHIYPAIDTVLNIIYSDDEKPVTAISIRDAALVKGYLNLFESLWKTADKGGRLVNF